MAALLLGAGRVLACDIDDDALAATERSAERNGVRQAIDVFPGSLEQVLERLRQSGPADVLAANILAPVLETMLGAGLPDAVRQGGTVILSGILAEQSAGVRSAADKAGLGLLAEESEGEWRSLILRKG